MRVPFGFPGSFKASWVVLGDALGVRVPPETVLVSLKIAFGEPSLLKIV